MIVELIRHGETALQAEQRYQGTTDAPLSAAGRAALRPAGCRPDVLIVTPLCRTAETASILFPGVPQRPVPALSEMNFGAFEGRSFREMEHDPAYRAWVESGCLSTCPGGESKEQFCARVCAAFSAVLDDALKAGTGTLAIVAHGGTQMAIMERFCEERRDYFSWHTGSGTGYLLDTAPWAAHRRLRLLRITDYRRG